MAGSSLLRVASQGRSRLSSEWRSCCFEDEGGGGVVVSVGILPIHNNDDGNATACIAEFVSRVNFEMAAAV